jgi:hypothetical protein
MMMEKLNICLFIPGGGGELLCNVIEIKNSKLIRQ